MTTKELVFIDDGLDLGKLPDLMSLGRRMIGLELATATSATAGLAWDDAGALFKRDEITCVPLVAFLPALLSFLPW